MSFIDAMDAQIEQIKNNEQIKRGRGRPKKPKYTIEDLENLKKDYDELQKKEKLKLSKKTISWVIKWKDKEGKEEQKEYRTLQEVQNEHPQLTRCRVSYICNRKHRAGFRKSMNEDKEYIEIKKKVPFPYSDEVILAAIKAVEQEMENNKIFPINPLFMLPGVIQEINEFKEQNN